MRRQLSSEIAYCPLSYQPSKSSHQQLNFIQKAYDLVNNPNNSEIIHWSRSGLTFIVEDIQRFQRELLPLYFRHNRYQSFVRQLNMYDFHKIRNGDYYCDNKSQFRHQEFCRGNLETILQIKRKGFQAKQKQKENTKIKKCHKINTRKKINRKIPVIKSAPAQPIAEQSSMLSEQNSFFADLPKINLEISTTHYKKKLMQQFLDKIVCCTIEEIQKNQIKIVKNNKISSIIQIAEIIKQKWIQQFEKVQGGEDIRTLKELYYRVKQQIRLKQGCIQTEQQKYRQSNDEVPQLTHISQEEEAVIESIFRAEIRSTLICITSQTFLNRNLQKRIDTLIGM